MRKMDDATVIKHMNARHQLKSLESMSPAVVKTLRRYHELVHASGFENMGEPKGEKTLHAVNHEHAV